MARGLSTKGTVRVDMRGTGRTATQRSNVRRAPVRGSNIRGNQKPVSRGRIKGQAGPGRSRP